MCSIFLYEIIIFIGSNFCNNDYFSTLAVKVNTILMFRKNKAKCQHLDLKFSARLQLRPSRAWEEGPSEFYYAASNLAGEGRMGEIDI